MSEYRQFVAAAMRSGYSMQEAGAAWRAGNHEVHGSPTSPEGRRRAVEKHTLSSLLRQGIPFKEAWQMARHKPAHAPRRAAAPKRRRNPMYGSSRINWLSLGLTAGALVLGYKFVKDELPSIETAANNLLGRVTPKTS